MNRFAMTIAAAAVSLFSLGTVYAQDGDADKAGKVKVFSDRYNLLVSKLGAAGVGVETVLNDWEAVDSSDVNMLVAKCNYYFAKSQSSEIVPRKDRKKYLGATPVLTLKDSTGAAVNYFQETFYDDSLYAMSARYIDKAISLYPDRLDLRLLKTTFLLAYEKESPDMTLAYLERLADENAAGTVSWKYPGAENEDGRLDSHFFQDMIQEYCYTFFNIGSAGSYSAFRRLSERMLESYPKNTVFLSNIGSYYLVAEKDYKAALKYYNKVLKIKPDDYTAIKNCVLIARSQKNTKLEKKYLPLLVKYGSDSERLAAEARLKTL